jgi:rhamnosyltransferase
MSDPLVSIILRSFNEGWALRETLPALRAQNYSAWELIVIDSGSTDDSVALIKNFSPRHFIQIAPTDYHPARVLNYGMSLARSEVGIFLNADATPQEANWLRPLVEALAEPKTAAAFGRQIPRPDCRAVFAHDYERCFGPHRESARWPHFFSLANSGIRKDVWRKRGFNDRLQYSEDDEYTRWCVAHGYHIAYVPNSIVIHSHNYSPQQTWKRCFGEGQALAAVWPRFSMDWNWPTSVLFGWANDVRRDWSYCWRHRRLREWPDAARIRWTQRQARFAGFRAGWLEYRTSAAPRVPLPPIWAAPAPKSPPLEPLGPQV